MLTARLPSCWEGAAGCPLPQNPTTCFPPFGSRASATSGFAHVRPPQLWFSRLESWSRDVSRLVFQSLGLGLRLEHQSLGLGLEDLSLGLFVFFCQLFDPKIKISVSK